MAIHRTDECGAKGNSYVWNERGKGYLGTLVVLLGKRYAGGDIVFSRTGAQTVSMSCQDVWYAYAAGTAHKMEPLSYGTRVSLQYDIYDAGSNLPLYNPFSSDSICFAHLLTRTISPVPVREEVIAAVQAELVKADTLVITLQYLYPGDDLQPENLEGGDRAFYDIFTQKSGQSRSPMHTSFDLFFVHATLQYRLDPDSNEKILENGTYSSCCGTGPTVRGSTENANFLVPTKLTSKHRAERNVDLLGPYIVKGFCVKKRNVEYILGVRYVNDVN